MTETERRTNWSGVRDTFWQLREKFGSKRFPAKTTAGKLQTEKLMECTPSTINSSNKYNNDVFVQVV